MRKSKWAYVFLIGSAAIFLYFLFAVKSGEQISFDRSLSTVFTGLFPESTYPFFEFMDGLGGKIGVGIVTLIFLIMLWVKHGNYAAMAALVFAVAIGNEVNKWLKNTIGRARPDQEHLVSVASLSFPSGHAMIGMILYTFIAFVIINGLRTSKAKWITGVLAGIWIFLMGISRIVMGVHYPSDVAAGFAAGFIWVFLSIVLYEAVKAKTTKVSYKKHSPKISP
ncbi:phosphatase PAP2 family protein [Cytobacillus sp. NCCP-133]|uniref:phosphatase PAP2 family protein n=1 Tax=Cytobacillus sp. NCCP-133 TaxID=766848 RepID=UPI0022318637|nr:phosphatase PAP2 family protein [Cytobacillus sp. NCCP-133]